MANSIAAALQLDLVLDSALFAFKQTLFPLALLSTAFYNVPLQGTNKVQVPYYPLETAASTDFDGTYKFPNGTSTLAKEITINKRKYQPLAFTSEELRRQPRFDPEVLGMLKGRKLAEDVLVDILSVVTAANFGAAIFTGIASDFDADDIIDMESTLTVAKWPRVGRGIIVGPTYIAGLKKDLNSGGGMATFNRDSNGASINFPEFNGFSFADTNVIPGNAENLVGFTCWRSAVLAGFAPITPAPEVNEVLHDYQVYTDDETGISVEFRSWGDADTDTAKRVIEVNYGFGAGEAAALKRIVSA